MASLRIHSQGQSEVGDPRDVIFNCEVMIRHDVMLVLSQHHKQVINLLLTMRRLIGFALYLDDGSLGRPGYHFEFSPRSNRGSCFRHLQPPSSNLIHLSGQS
jgi:hypothetical protein